MSLVCARKWSTNECGPQVGFELRSSDEMPEYKNECLSVGLPGNLPHEAPQIHEEVKDGEGIQRG